MSCDFAVWFPHTRLSNSEATDFYGHLCEGTGNPATPHPAVDEFYRDLTSKYPELDDVPEDRIGDAEFCPWSATHDHSPGHVIMCCVRSKAEDVKRFILSLAEIHRLAVYDPQTGHVVHPEEKWKFWRLSDEVHGDIPLRENHALREVLEDLDGRRNSFCILEHVGGDYIQCGGARTSCTVEFRARDEAEDEGYLHCVVGRSDGSNQPAEIQMSAGVCTVVEREVLDGESAAVLFAAFFSGSGFSEEYSLRRREL